MSEPSGGQPVAASDSQPTVASGDGEDVHESFAEVCPVLEQAVVDEQLDGGFGGE